mmetsp:Transcript_88208/g.251909  ORF Transcript_88208/g.251909 Transcript_88208/m.251909 type:complete len:306 (-) Transcript_88208:615-1532(-)
MSEFHAASCESHRTAACTSQARPGARPRALACPPPQHHPPRPLLALDVPNPRPPKQFRHQHRCPSRDQIRRPNLQPHPPPPAPRTDEGLPGRPRRAWRVVRQDPWRPVPTATQPAPAPQGPGRCGTRPWRRHSSHHRCRRRCRDRHRNRRHLWARLFRPCHLPSPHPAGCHRCAQSSSGTGHTVYPAPPPAPMHSRASPRPASAIARRCRDPASPVSVAARALSPKAHRFRLSRPPRSATPVHAASARHRRASCGDCCCPAVHRCGRPCRPACVGCWGGDGLRPCVFRGTGWCCVDAKPTSFPFR